MTVKPEIRPEPPNATGPTSPESTTATPDAPFVPPGVALRRVLDRARVAGLYAPPPPVREIPWQETAEYDAWLERGIQRNRAASFEATSCAKIV